MFGFNNFTYVPCILRLLLSHPTCCATASADPEGRLLVPVAPQL